MSKTRESFEHDAKALADLIIEWVDGGTKFGTDWRSTLPEIIAFRLERLGGLGRLPGFRRPSPGIGESEPVSALDTFRSSLRIAQDAVAAARTSPRVVPAVFNSSEGIERDADPHPYAPVTTKSEPVSEEAVEAAERAQAEAQIGLADHPCQRCDGHGTIITGHGADAGGDTCPDCGGVGAIVEFPDGWSPMRRALEAARPYLSQPIAATALVEAATVEIERLRDLHCMRREAFEIIGDDDKAALLSDFVGQLAGLRDAIRALASLKGDRG